MKSYKRKPKAPRTFDDIEVEWNEIKAKGENTYTQYKKRKSRGGYRTISVPSDSLKKLQKDLNYKLSFMKLEHPFALGFRKNKNIANNALAHRVKPENAFKWRGDYIQGRKHVFADVTKCTSTEIRYYAPKSGVNLDVKDAFGSVTVKLMQEALHEYDRFSPHQIDLMIEIGMHQGKLPQGAPTSPLLLNVAMFMFDTYVTHMIRKKLGEPSNAKFVYTRFADDITITSDKYEFAKKTIGFVAKALTRYGFELNNKKTHVMSLKSGMFVTGINIVNSYTHVSTSRRSRDKVKSAIYQLSEKSVEDPDYKEAHARVMGRIGYILSTDFVHGGKLIEQAIAARIISGRSKFRGMRASSIMIQSLQQRERRYEVFKQKYEHDYNNNNNEKDQQNIQTNPGQRLGSIF